MEKRKYEQAILYGIWNEEPARLLIVGSYRPADVLREDHPMHSVANELVLRGFAEELALPFLAQEAVFDYLADKFHDAHLGARMDRPYYLGLLAEACSNTDRIDEGMVVLDEALVTVRKSRS